MMLSIDVWPLPVAAPFAFPYAGGGKTKPSSVVPSLELFVALFVALLMAPP